MLVDLAAATSFVATHARHLDRLRFDLALKRGDPVRTHHALDAYRNADAGYGAIEPDLRAYESQPVGAMHAFEVMIEIFPDATEEATELCDWLDEVTLADGGLPFALPIADPTGCAPFWAEADPRTSSLHITAAVTAQAYELARSNDGVARHPWLQRATEFCIARIAAMEEAGHALELLFSMRFLDAAHEAVPEALGHLERLGAFIPEDGLLHVAGGLEDEFIRPLDFAPEPERPIRSVYEPTVVDSELNRLEELQQSDGGWPCDFASYSPAAALEWRGYLTVGAVKTLKSNGRI